MGEQPEDVGLHRVLNDLEAVVGQVFPDELVLGVDLDLPIRGEGLQSHVQVGETLVLTARLKKGN